MTLPRRTSALLCAAATAVLALPAGAGAQQISRCDFGDAEFAKTSRPARYEIGPQENVSLVSERDGVAIDVAIFRPEGAERRRIPVILNATPYHHAQPSLDVRACKPYFVDNLVPQGYAMAFVAVRGTGNSGGCFDLFGPAERADVDQVVTWLGTRPWSNGRVGMIGKSYEGGTPWGPAAAGNPHLKTIVSMAGVPDVFELLFANGEIDIRGPLLLNDLYYGPSIVTFADGREPARTVEAAACPDYVRGNLASAHSALTGLPDPYGYWAERRFTDQIVERYRGSVFITQGFLDLNVPAGVQFGLVDRLRAKGRAVKLWLGQWGHVDPDQADEDAARQDWPDVLLRWFDRYLRGGRASTGPRVEVQDTARRWRRERRWPPAGSPETLWLGGDGTLRPEPSGATATRLLLPDPLHVETGPAASRPALPRALESGCPLPTCTAFATEPVPAELHFAGRPELALRVRPVAAAGHVSAYLYADDGTTATRIGWGQADVRFPASDERFVPPTPGEPTEMRLRLQPLDAVVPAGSRLVVVVGQGAAYDRMPSVPTAPMGLVVGGGAGALRFVRVR